MVIPIAVIHPMKQWNTAPAFIVHRMHFDVAMVLVLAARKNAMDALIVATEVMKTMRYVAEVRTKV